MKKEYLVNVTLIAAILSLIVVASTGCGVDAVAETGPLATPAYSEPMDYNNPRYTDEQVIDHMLGSNYAEFSPANANARITVIKKKLAEAEEDVRKVETSIRVSDTMIGNNEKDLSYFPPEYLNWEEYVRSKGEVPSLYKKKKEKRLKDEQWYRETLDQRKLDAEFQVKLRKAEIAYLKAMAS